MVTRNKSIFILRKTSLVRPSVFPIHDLPFSKVEIVQFPGQPFPANFNLIGSGQGHENTHIIKASLYPVSHPPVMLDYAFTCISARTLECHRIMQRIRRIVEPPPLDFYHLPLEHFSKLRPAWMLPRTCIHCIAEHRSSETRLWPVGRWLYQSWRGIPSLLAA